jgi:hypothetical protein
MSKCYARYDEKQQASSEEAARGRPPAATLEARLLESLLIVESDFEGSSHC